MLRPGYRSERLVFLFALGLLAFNAPILGLFDRIDSAFGIPVLYLYLFLVWACLIGFAAISLERGDVGDDQAQANDNAASPKRGA